MPSLRKTVRLELSHRLPTCGLTLPIHLRNGFKRIKRGARCVLSQHGVREKLSRILPLAENGRPDGSHSESAPRVQDVVEIRSDLSKDEWYIFKMVMSRPHVCPRTASETVPNL